MLLELYNDKYNLKGEPISYEILDTETGEIIEPMFSHYSSRFDYERDRVRWLEPMTAKEYLNEEALELMLNSKDYIAEVKLDGTRALCHLGSYSSRLFSRRVSKKTGWFSENTDSVPHLRGIAIPYLEGTVIDGEMRIDGKEFKEVSSTLNCDWKKAIYRQIDIGFITFHAFDIIYYRGVNVSRMSLERRKHYLSLVIKQIKDFGCNYVVNEPYTDDKIEVCISEKMVRDYFNRNISKEVYPNLYVTIKKGSAVQTFAEFMEVESYAPLDFQAMIDKRTWYEYILYNGGEGLMLKPKSGHYHQTRGREYTKWKKFITRDCILLGFSEPTHYYDEEKGKSLTWDYWEDAEDDSITENKTLTFLEADEKGLIPITKFYYMEWVGNMRFGVVVTSEEVKMWEKVNKQKAKLSAIQNTKDGSKMLILEVGECAGFDEEQRAKFTKNVKSYTGRVVEILANEIFKETGKLRHPRLMRFRKDKNAEQCTWEDHVNA
jgi:ATP-dependent DNA ligase